MTMENDPPKLTPADLADLRLAKRKLEYPSFAAQVSNLVGRPLESSLRVLPGFMRKRIDQVTQSALLKGLEIATRTLDGTERPARNMLHKVLTAGSGAVGGALGGWALSVELPLSTTLILRSIADIARSEGHDLGRLDVQLACMEVFALGGRSEADDATESGYWAARASLSKAIGDAAAYLAQNGFAAEGAPPLVRLISTIASRLSVDVSAQVAAKALPVVSAAAGAGINLLFMHHYQEMARGHFIVKRLERHYGNAVVEERYRALDV